MDYIVFDLDYLYGCFHMIRSNLGTIFSVAFYLFIIVFGIFTVVNIVRKISG